MTMTAHHAAGTDRWRHADTLDPHYYSHHVKEGGVDVYFASTDRSQNARVGLDPPPETRQK